MSFSDFSNASTAASQLSTHAINTSAQMLAAISKIRGDKQLPAALTAAVAAQQATVEREEPALPQLPAWQNQQQQLDDRFHWFDQGQAQQQEAETIAHTPGPWTVFSNAQWPGIDAGKDKAVIYFGDDLGGGGIRGDSHEEAVANARLIAAAPELLVAVRAAAEFARHILEEQAEPDFGHTLLVRDALRAAIEKAEGRQQ